LKKIFIAAIVVMLLAATGSFAAGGTGLAIGGEAALTFAGTGGLPMGAMLMLHLPRFPLMLGIGVSTTPAIGLTADYWAAQGKIVSIFDWYFGIGGYLLLNLNPVDISLGARIPLGLQMWPLGRSLEIFIEVAPAVGVSLIPTGFDWHFQGALGLRFWF
jgi:hypothetical protein